MPRRISHKQLDWTLVKQYYNEHTTTGYAMAAIEARKRLAHTLKKRHIAGTTIKDQIRIAGPYFSEPKDIQEAELLMQQLIKEPDASLTGKEASLVITTFRQATEELEGGPTSQLGISERLRIRVLTRYTKAPDNAKKAAVAIPALLILITLLSTTNSGRLTASLVATAAEFIVSWVFVIAAILIALAFIIFGSLAYFEKRRK